MTFDDLWRLDLPRKGPFMYSIHTLAETEIFDGTTLNGSVDDLEETEMNRFLEWLEKSLRSADAGERSIFRLRQDAPKTRFD